MAMEYAKTQDLLLLDVGQFTPTSNFLPNLLRDSKITPLYLDDHFAFLLLHGPWWLENASGTAMQCAAWKWNPLWTGAPSPEPWPAARWMSGGWRSGVAMSLTVDRRWQWAYKMGDKDHHMSRILKSAKVKRPLCSILLQRRRFLLFCGSVCSPHCWLETDGELTNFKARILQMCQTWQQNPSQIYRIQRYHNIRRKVVKYFWQWNFIAKTEISQCFCFLASLHI